MTRTTPPLQQHLLTRSDLARMGVPAAQILAWLAANAIEQVGSLGEPGDEDPVFTVAGSLRAELTAKLAEIGKRTVVLSPLRVRSFLLRAMLPRHTAAATESAVEAIAEASRPEADLAEVLQEAARCIAANVEVVLQLATEEARLEVEADSGQTPDSLMESSHEMPPSAALAETDGARTDQTCFDFDDLASELDDLLGGEPIAKPSVSAVEAAPVDAVTATPIEPETPQTPATGAAAAPMAQEASSHDDASKAAVVVTTASSLAAPAANSDAMEHQSEAPAPEAIGAISDPTASASGTTAPGAVADDAIAVDEPDVAIGIATAAANTASGMAVEPAVRQVATVNQPVDPPTEPRAPSMPESAVASPPAATDAAENAATAPKPSGAVDTMMTAALTTTTEAMQRVESFLDQLKSVLVEMAQRPPTPVTTLPPASAPAVDVAPLVAALQAGFDRSAQQSVATSTALTVLTEKIGSLGQHVEHGMQQAVAELRRAPPPERRATELIITRSDRTPIALFAVAALMMAWATLFWFKTGSSRLALGTLIGANVVACCLLAAWRRRH